MQSTKQPDNKTTKQPDNTNVFLSIDNLLLFIDVFILFVLFIHSLIIAARFVWKTIPSEARVTRDEVSGYMMQRDSCLEDSTKTYKDIEMTKRIINKVLSSRQFLPSCP